MTCFSVVLLIPMIAVIIRRLFFREKKKIEEPPPIVQIKPGKISGHWGYSNNGNRMFASFVGIPYAKAPVGKLRFRRPEPADSWEGVRVCTKSVEFIQRNIFKAGSPKEGKEDGLVLNVYTPNLKGKLPVMVFIHGGGYVCGSGSRAVYGPENFMDKDVILVTINYRVGVLGGLFIDGDEVPGNQCMRDQVLALKWVQENIDSFGGIKERVTIFGESAGGMSVMNHVLSPMSAGLFSAAISQSGAPFSTFVCNNKHPAYYGHKLLECLGIDPKSSIEAIMEKLEARDPLELQGKQMMFEEFVRAPLPFKPIVDGGLVKDPFLPEEPIELLRKGKYNKVPLIIGTNRDEGLLIKAFYMRNAAKNFPEGYNNFTKIGPLAFFAKERDEATEYEGEVCLEYRSKHFPMRKFSPEGEAGAALTQMYGDLIFTSPCDRTIREMVKSTDTPIYQYLYNHIGTVSLYEIVAYPAWKLGLHILSLTLGWNILGSSGGVCHGDELFLLFRPRLPFNPARTSQDKKVRDTLVQMWTDFATHHNPTPKTGSWQPCQSDRPHLLEITADRCEMKYPSGHGARMSELREIYKKIPMGMTNRTSPTWSQFPHDRYPIPE